MNLEPVFIAANDREAAFVERLLEEQGIEYELKLETVKRETSAPCYQVLMFEVLAGQADRCRQLFEKSGLTAGIV